MIALFVNIDERENENTAINPFQPSHCIVVIAMKPLQFDAVVFYL